MKKYVPFLNNIKKNWLILFKQIVKP
jgi:hypothetical protein